MKNQTLSMALAWLVSVGAIPESTTTTITDFVGMPGYERPFEFAAVIILGFVFQTVKPLWDLIPLWSQSYANKMKAEFNLPDDLDESKPKGVVKKPADPKKTSKPAGE